MAVRPLKQTNLAFDCKRLPICRSTDKILMWYFFYLSMGYPVSQTLTKAYNCLRAYSYWKWIQTTEIIFHDSIWRDFPRFYSFSMDLSVFLSCSVSEKSQQTNITGVKPKAKLLLLTEANLMYHPLKVKYSSSNDLKNYVAIAFQKYNKKWRSK